MCLSHRWWRRFINRQRCFGSTGGRTRSSTGRPTRSSTRRGYFVVPAPLETGHDCVEAGSVVVPVVPVHHLRRGEVPHELQHVGDGPGTGLELDVRPADPSASDGRSDRIDGELQAGVALVALHVFKAHAPLRTAFDEADVFG